MNIPSHNIVLNLPLLQLMPLDHRTHLLQLPSNMINCLQILLGSQLLRYLHLPNQMLKVLNGRVPNIQWLDGIHASNGIEGHA